MDKRVVPGVALHKTYRHCSVAVGIEASSCVEYGNAVKLKEIAVCMYGPDVGFLFE